MIVLDTDHLGEFQKGTSAEARQLEERLGQSGDVVATSIVSVEEILRGWLAAIHRQHDPNKQIQSYARLQRVIATASSWLILPWNAAAVAEFESLRATRLRLGTMDLKIAAIALAHDALLLSANLRDFHQIPRLRVEDWLHTGHS
jgi:tRNA(fMet)-specific endonuclease VapC